MAQEVQKGAALPQWSFFIPSRVKGGITLAQRFKEVHDVRKKTYGATKATGSGVIGQPKKSGASIATKAARAKAGKNVENLPPNLRGTKPAKMLAAAPKTKKAFAEEAAKKRKTGTAGKVPKTRALAQATLPGAKGKGPKGKLAWQKKVGHTAPVTLDSLDSELIKHRLGSTDDSGKILLDRQLEDFCREMNDEEM